MKIYVKPILREILNTELKNYIYVMASSDCATKCYCHSSCHYG